jgi:colanic acid/amylovoran biosynthesis glycosyltransferase
MRLAYFINQYPKVSHSFIRREIVALERLGFSVCRIALRGWAGEIVDPDDLMEREKTQYVLQDGILPLFFATLRMAFSHPLRLMGALCLALRMSRLNERSWAYHLIYLAEACRIAIWMKQFGAQHVHAHFGTNSTEVVMLAAAMGGPAYSFTVHGPEEFDKPQALHLKEKIARSAFVVAISSFGRSQLYRWANRSDWHKAKIIRCGLEKAFHQVEVVKLPAAPRLVCVGRICEQKGQLLLIEAAARLAQRGVEFELVLAGDGEMRGEVESLIARHGLVKQVRITGWLSSAQVRDELLQARALVLPSFAEGLPVVIMEAMALRRPVLTTWIAGIPELIRDGVHGWLLPPSDVGALVAGMERCLQMTIDELEQIGANAHSLVLQMHDIDREAEKLGALFKSSIEARAIEQ